jgi:hypothetical protein
MRFRLSIILTAFFFYSGQACADGWQQDGSVGISAAYNTNPSLSTAYPGGAWIGSVTPSYTLRGNVGANQYRSGLAYRIERSSNTAVSSDREDPTIFLEWKRRIDLNEFGIFTQYHESSTRVAEINNIGPGFVDSNAFYRIITGTWNRELSERSTFFADCSYESVSFGGGIYTNYVTRTANMLSKYDLSERSTPFVKISYVDYLPENTTQMSRMNTVMLGWNWIASQRLEGDLQIGKTTGVNVPVGSLYGATLHYKDERAGIDLSASRQALLSGLSGFILVDQAIGSWNYALSDFNKSGIDLSWRKNYYVDAVTNSSASAWLEHDFNSGWKGRTYYMHRISKQVGVDGSAYSNEIGITLLYTQTDF